MKSNQLHLRSLTILMVMWIATLQSCDYVDAPYGSFTPPPVSNRKVLLEDFSGHTCANCPHASRIAQQLKDSYGEQLVLITIHGGDFAYPMPIVPPDSMYYYDFRTPEGDELNVELGIQAWPTGSVNRKTINNTRLVYYTAWGGVISDILQEPPYAALEITNGFNTSSRQISTSIKCDFIKELPDNYSLAVYLTEDSIINWQLDQEAVPEDVKDYVHRHVLRGSFSGTYGEAIIAAPDSGASVTKQYTLTIPAEYNENHCAVVAFIFNTTTKEVVQVEEKKLIP